MAMSNPYWDAKSQGAFSRTVLDSGESRRCIGSMRELVSSCLGPRGKVKTVQNTCGGHLTLTSTSQRFLPAVSVTNPVLKLVTGSMLSHLNAYRDGGQFASTLSLSLVDTAVSLAVNRRLVVDLFDFLLKEAVDYLKDESCPCKFTLKDGGLDGLLRLARSIIGTKPLCCLYGADLDHMTRLVVEAFLKSIPEADNLAKTPDNVHFLQAVGRPVSESRLFTGVLLDLCGRCSVSPSAIRSVTNCPDGALIPVAVVNASMAGDLEDFVDAAGYDVADDISLDAVSRSRLKNFAQALIKARTKVVFCQKVVCPDTKSHLLRNDILVVDRLGAAACRAVQRLTGARLISVITSALHKDCLGQLTNLSVQGLHGQSYLLLTGPTDCDVSLVVCHRQGEGTEELQSVCEAALQSLYLHLYQPQVLTGGGCWQSHLAHWLRVQVMHQTDDLTTKYHCSRSQLRSVTDAFCNSLQHCAILIGGIGEDLMVDSANHHVWRCGGSDWMKPGGNDLDPRPESCQCGLVRDSESVHLHYVKENTSLPETNRSSCLMKGSSVGSHSSDIQGSVGGNSCNSTAEDKGLSQNDKGFPDTLVILDSFPVQVNAFLTAVTTSIAALSICQYIRDTN